MAVTPFRWVAAAIAGCLIISVGILGRGTQPGSGDVIDQNLQVRDAMYRVQARAFGGRLRLASLLDSTRLVIARSSNASPIRVFRDSGIPAEARVPLDSLASRAVRAVRDSGRMGIDIVFLYDTVTTVRGVAVRRFGPYTDYVLPSRADDRCTVLVHVGNDPTIRVQLARIIRSEEAAEQLLGPCAYYRAFGMPGRLVDVWLRDRGWAFAHDGSWLRPAPTIDLTPNRGPGFGTGQGVSFLWEMRIDGARCGLGETDSCTRALIDRPPSEGSTWYGYTPPTFWNYNVLYQSYSALGRGRDAYYRRVLGRREPFLLADMVRILGRERFARFWTSNESVPAAFERAAGEPIGRWTSRWVVDQYGSTAGRGPGVSAWTGAISALLCALAIFVAVRVSAHRQYA